MPAEHAWQRRVFLTTLPNGHWAAWTATAESASSIRIQRIRDHRDTDPGRWHDGRTTPPLPRGMIAFAFDQEPALDYVRTHLPSVWADLWRAVAAEYAQWTCPNGETGFRSG